MNELVAKKIIAKLDYTVSSFPDCNNQMKKYDFQKPSKIPYLETTGMPNPYIIQQKIAQKLVEKLMELGK